MELQGIVGRLEAGQFQVQICRVQFKFAQRLVCNLWNSSWIPDPSRESLGKGRPRVTTATEDRYLPIIARRNRRAIASSALRDLYVASDTRVSVGDCFQPCTGLFCKQRLLLPCPAHFYEQERFGMVQRA
ncbi:hypothetical protein AVEN_188266-1 [Araneus ventricosus]|uniref:Uncharacterized protein n=1 Tax=Araneus ventricosus TaxID=182803 RepID=A0A4Y2C5C3_ARAVE|nr:hypothetical protein AVEN_188266-1 [Araneus ventricosus]